MQVICNDKYFSNRCFKEHIGTIVFVLDGIDETIGVEWDKSIFEITGGIHSGHSCNGRCKNGYGYYGYANDVEPFNPSVEDEYDFKISIESLF